MDINKLKTRRVKEYTDIDGLKSLIPTRLYKYRYWNDNVKHSFHKYILTERQLYFSDSYSFDDPYDCRFPVNFDYSFESIKERMKKSYYKLLGLHVLKNEQLESLIKQQYNERFGTEANRKIREREFYKLFNETLVSYCLSMSNNNKKMWNKYGDKFNGFCVGFDFHKDLQSLLDANIGGTYVQYVNKTTEHMVYPDINTEGGLEDYTWFSNDLIRKKYKSWSFEKEYRFYKWNFDYLNNLEIPEFNNIYTVPHSCFDEIIFGYKMNQKHIEEIMEVCKKNNIWVSFKIADLHKNSVVIRDI
ncbi:DUF2971 domain-containing protein [Persicitalea sp.]|uniref:DUF2971 domain-containing protein n=1 Tax=Persicitalea sp. TaxID=3100273 RepID=UPI003593B981